MKQALITVAFLVGLSAITAGCALLHPALGFIVGGTLLVGVAVQLDRGAAAPTSESA